MTSNMWAALVSGGLVEQLWVSGGRAEITQRFLGGLAGEYKGGRGDDEKMGERKGCAVSR